MNAWYGRDPAREMEIVIGDNALAAEDDLWDGDTVWVGLHVPAAPGDLVLAFLEGPTPEDLAAGRCCGDCLEGLAVKKLLVDLHGRHYLGNTVADTIGCCPHFRLLGRVTRVHRGRRTSGAGSGQAAYS